MEKVLGFGGFFFKADDPAKLSLWYETHLGIDQTPQSYEAKVWTQEEGPTVFAPFGQDVDAPHLGATGWGLNFRVSDLDAMVQQLRAAEIAVEVESEIYPNGRFAQLQDPEGNAIQLWEPK